MSDTRDMLSVHRPDGSVIVHRLEPLTDASRAICDEVFADIDQRDFAPMLLVLAERIADEEAYARVCERRGVLAL